MTRLILALSLIAVCAPLKAFAVAVPAAAAVVATIPPSTAHEADSTGANTGNASDVTAYPLYGNWVWGGGWLSALGTNFHL